MADVEESGLADLVIFTMRKTMIRPALLIIASTIRLVEVASFMSPGSIAKKLVSTTQLTMSTATDTSSWSTLQKISAKTKVGAALDKEVESRNAGTGAPFVQNKLRLFDSSDR